MKNIFINLTVLTLALFTLISCTKELRLSEIGFDKSYQVAKKKYDNEDYMYAADDFEVILLNYSGNEGIDSVQFLLAESRFKLEEYYTASFEYEKLADRFPDSKLTKQSLFNSALSYFQLSPSYEMDQKETRKAIKKFQNFIEIYRNDSLAVEADKKIKILRNKLARKDYETGVLYLKMDEPRAAKVSFTALINEFYDTDYYIPSIEKLALSYKEMEDDYNYRLYMERFNKLSKENE